MPEMRVNVCHPNRHDFFHILVHPHPCSLDALGESPAHIQSVGHVQSTSLSLCSGLFQLPLDIFSLLPTRKTSPLTMEWPSLLCSMGYRSSVKIVYHQKSKASVGANRAEHSIMREHTRWFLRLSFVSLVYPLISAILVHRTIKRGKAK